MKKNIDLARAWRDEDYYLSLSEEDRASLRENPAGVLGLQDEALKSIAGGCSTNVSMAYSCDGTFCDPTIPRGDTGLVSVAN